MKKLFIIDGAMRPAKNELVEYIKKLERNRVGDVKSSACIVPKFCDSNGPEHYEEDQDYIKDVNLASAISDDEKQWITYSYSGRLYGIKKTVLDCCINEHENVFLIVRNTELVFELKEKYSRYHIPLKVVTVYIYSDKEAISNEYKEQDGIDLNERKKRLDKADRDYENAMAVDENYDETIIYTHKDGRGSASLAVKIKALISKYKNVIEPSSMFFIHSYKDPIVAREKYETLVQAAQEAFNKEKVECISLINGKGSYKIGDTVWEMIEKNDYIICDITSFDHKKGVSPNIWLELGYALCIMKKRNIKVGKKLIIVKQGDGIESLPADIRDFNIIMYNSNEDFKVKLIDQLKDLSQRV